MTETEPSRLDALTRTLLDAGWRQEAVITADASARVGHSLMTSPGRACHLHASYYPATGEIEATLDGLQPGREQGPAWRVQLGDLDPALIHAAARAALARDERSVGDVLTGAGWGTETETLKPDGVLITRHASLSRDRIATFLHTRPPVEGTWSIDRHDMPGPPVHVVCDPQVPAPVIAALALTHPGRIPPRAPVLGSADQELEALTSTLAAAGWEQLDLSDLQPSQSEQAQGFRLRVLASPEHTVMLVATRTPKAANTEITSTDPAKPWRIDAGPLPARVLAATAIAASQPGPAADLDTVAALLADAGWRRAQQLDAGEFSQVELYAPYRTRTATASFLHGPGHAVHFQWLIERDDLARAEHDAEASASPNAPARAITALALTD